MKFGLDVPTTGEYADPRTLAQLAIEAEAAGWDGFFLWDVLLGGADMTTAALDPWIALTAVALNTTRIRIGALATPLARERPWLAARRIANLDQASNGRMICVAGLGFREADFTAFGEEGDAKIRAQKLDEGLAILSGLLTEERFSFAGERYTVEEVTLRPQPAQSPRPPIWLAAGWPRRTPVRRAARWDGLCLKSYHQDRREPLTPTDVAEALAYVREQRASDGPFDVAVSGESPAEINAAREQAQPFSEAGATWWIEEGLGWTLEEFRARIHAGPPKG
ncbi:MAG TPA: LLM class flavin-dependent oxidoreductase [Ktedonobacterales bacterium]|jgi:alkanesulfonate monooxygenase SsuD/methylene tetrahydromethanopterin reductase-like flavin-dependent oxidoreductase (luciferase family)